MNIRETNSNLGYSDEVAKQDRRGGVKPAVLKGCYRFESGPCQVETFPGFSKDEVPQTGCSYRARLSLKWPESWLASNSRTRVPMERGISASLCLLN